MMSMLETFMENTMPFLLLLQAGVYLYEFYVEYKRAHDPEEIAKQERREEYERIKAAWSRVAERPEGHPAVHVSACQMQRVDQKNPGESIV